MFINWKEVWTQGDSGAYISVVGVVQYNTLLLHVYQKLLISIISIIQEALNDNVTATECR